MVDTDNKCSGGILQHGRISTVLHWNCWPVWLKSQGFFILRREKFGRLYLGSSLLGSRHLLSCHNHLNIHFTGSLFYSSSVKSCYWKKWQWKSWNSGKDLPGTPKGNGESWTIQVDWEKSVRRSTRDLMLHIVTFDNIIEHTSSRKNSKSSLVTNILTSGVSFTPLTVKLEISYA